MLSRINPLAKLICNLFGIILSFMIFDLIRLSTLLCLAIGIAILEGNFNYKNIKKVLPLLLFGIGMFITTLFWGNGTLDLELKNLEIAIKLFLRIAIIGGLACGFLFNINPNEMLLSLMQNLKLNPGIAYGIIVAFRFFPMMEEDMFMIKTARSIRLGEKKNNFRDMMSLPIPLLATNVRRAEKVAIAMEARGFDRFSKRTSYREVPWKKRDTIYILAVVSLFIGIYYITGTTGDWTGY